MSAHTPAYRLHKSTGQAVVTIDGRDFYLGLYRSAASRLEYDRLIAEWLANGRQLPRGGCSDLAVSEIILRYIWHAEAYYVKNGKPTNESANIKLAMKPLRALYGHTLARDFGPLALKAVRQKYVEAGLCRNECNKRARHIVRLFKWAASEELVPVAVHEALRTVTGLRHGRSDARETAKVRPAPEAMVEAIRPHVPRQVWAMIELQRLTGARPGEVCIMRTGDIDRSGPVWVYIPGSHKTEHHGRERVIFIGPQAQAILKPWLRADPGAYLFAPADAEAERHERMRAARKTRVQPSQQGRRKRKPRKSPGDRYTTGSYCQAIKYACEKLCPHPTLADFAARRKSLRTRAERQALDAERDQWKADHKRELKEWRRNHSFHPHQLRHEAATRLRKAFGLDAARVVLGHASAAVAEIYAEVDHEKAREIMGRVG